MDLHVININIELTFACLQALRPTVINVQVADTSTVLKPSTTRSAATVSAGFPERAAFGARHRFSERRRGDCRPDY